MTISSSEKTKVAGIRSEKYWRGAGYFRAAARGQLQVVYLIDINLASVQ